MNSFYWFAIFPISYSLFKTISNNIKKQNKKNEDLLLLNQLYNLHIQCLINKGFLNNQIIFDDYELKKNNNFKIILQNKNIQELESCKNTYINFICAYRKFKNNDF